MASPTKETGGKRKRRDAKLLLRRQRKLRLQRAKQPTLADVLK